MINIPKQLAILIPTFGRPHALARVVDNIYANTPHELFNIYFIIEPADFSSIGAAQALKANIIFNDGLPCYADAINTAYRKTSEPYFFTGADDLDFKPGWAEQALSHMKGKIKVVGTNDMGGIPIGEQRLSTHYLVARDYIKKQSGVIDHPNTVLFPYLHNYTDKEFTEVAMSRGVFAYCPESLTEHLHWAWGKAQMDATYKRGNETSEQDRRTYEGRRHLWQ